MPRGRFTPVGARLVGLRLRQPDARSCGAAAVVMAHALADDAYAELLMSGTHPRTGWQLPGTPAERFRSEVLAMHRRITSLVSRAGRLQVPWLRIVGTAPWSVAAQLTGRQRWRACWFRLSPRRRTAEVAAVVSSGRSVPLYVGTRLLPRHVVLAVDAEVVDGDAVGLWCYDPANGRIRPLRRLDLDRGRAGLGRWNTVWWAVLPDDNDPQEAPSAA